MEIWSSQYAVMMEVIAKTGVSAGEIAGHFDIAQPSVSRHLEVLKNAGIITSRRQANQVIYSLNLSMVQEMIMEVMELLGRGEEEHYDAET